jgi:hypothetical protein
MILNTRVLSAWPNWLLIPAMVAFWVFFGVLAAELFQHQKEKTNA